MRNWNNPIFIYSKKVKGRAIKSEKVDRTSDKKKISEVIDSLRILGKEKTLEDVDFGENCTRWVLDILSGYPTSNETSVDFLLNDFTDSMKTRSREEDKYAISIVSQNSLLLCHSRIGEQTITPFWKVAERMLDTDNVDRFVYFSREKDLIRINYFESSRSEFLVHWLGIPEKDAFYYLGGKNRIYVLICGMHCSLELSDDDIEEKFLREQILMIDRNQLLLPSEIRRLQIEQIRVGKKRYNSAADFLQVYLARRYELTYYQEEYEKLSNSLDPLTIRFIDDRDYLVKIESGNEKVHLTKKNPNFHILFAGKMKSGGVIEVRSSFANQIASEFLNAQKIRIFHAGMNMYSSPRPLCIKTMEIYNELELDDLTYTFLEYYNETRPQDKSIDDALGYLSLLLAQKACGDKPISYIFDTLMNEILPEIRVSDVLLQNENDVIEFKSRDFLVGKDREIFERISKDLVTKMESSSFKIYIFGVDEKFGRMEPLNSDRFSSDRIGHLERKISSGLGGNTKILLAKVPIRGNNECLLILVAKALSSASAS